MDFIDTILFDWDGTLVDSAQSAFDAFRKAFCDLGIPVEYELYERVYSPNWYSIYQALHLPREKWQAADDLWIQHYGQKVSGLVQGGAHVLDELRRRHYDLGIVTSGSRSRIFREISALDLSGIFQIVVCNEDVLNKKPHPEGLETAMVRMNKRAEVCCYVGDSPDDIEMGRRAKIRTVGIRGRYPSSKKLDSANPNYCLESITQLLDCFKKATVHGTNYPSLH